MRELDTKCAKIIEQLKREANNPTPTAQMSSGKKKGKDKYLEAKLKEVLDLSEEKIEISNQTYEQVDKCIRRLDEELLRFQNFMQREKDIVNNTTSPAVVLATAARKKTGGGAKKSKSKVKNFMGLSQQEMTLEEQIQNSTAALVHYNDDYQPPVKKSKKKRNPDAPAPRSKEAYHSKLMGLKLPALASQAQPSLLHDFQTQPMLSEDLLPEPEPVSDIVKQPSLVIKIASQQSARAQQGTPTEKGKNKRTFQEMEDVQGKEKPATPSGNGRRKIKKITALPPAPIIEQPTELIPVDPNEPVYCYCRKVSFGEMVACDSDDCQNEWFHFACVGLKEAPKGKWYCQDCLAKQKNK
jgi:hypothetical protein